MNSYIALFFALIYYTVTLFLLRKYRFSTTDLCLASIVIAMTLVLEAIQFPLPTGATISLCSPVPLMVLAIIADYRLAIISGWICGFLAMLMIPGWQLVHWGQFFVEHMVCFSCLGFAGAFGIEKRSKIVLGIAISSLIKITGHLVSGVVFFSQNAWGGWGAWGYSLAYNLSQNLPLCILSAMVVLLLPLGTLNRQLNGGKK